MAGPLGAVNVDHILFNTTDRWDFVAHVLVISATVFLVYAANRGRSLVHRLILGWLNAIPLSALRTS